eukprot:15477697-Alexandrium_andersonii.AAC.1
MAGPLSSTSGATGTVGGARSSSPALGRLALPTPRSFATPSTLPPPPSGCVLRAQCLGTVKSLSPSS